MYIGEIIKKYRDENKLSQRTFAARTSLSPSYINTLEKVYNPKTGKPYSITTDAAQDLSKAMRMPMQDLLDQLNDSQEFSINNNRSIRIPVLGKIPAGIPVEMVEDIIEGEFEDISEDMLKGDKQYFALKIDEENGHSMEPDYKPGDVLIVLKQECCENGDDCIVAINGDDATFKKVYKYESGITLQPINTSQYQPIFFSNQEIIDKPVKVLGIVVEFRRKTKRRENL